MSRTDKTTISQDEYITLAGLLKIADEHQRALDNMIVLIATIIGDDLEYPDWSYEAISERYGVDEFLRKLQITIEKETDTP